MNNEEIPTGHLILTRRPGEQIIISKDLEKLAIITVTEIKNGGVKFTIKAPLDLDVDREEIYLRKLTDKNKDADNYGNIA